MWWKNLWWKERGIPLGSNRGGGSDGSPKDWGDTQTAGHKYRNVKIHLVNIKKSRRYIQISPKKHQIQNTEEGWMILGLGTLLGMGYGNIPPISGFCPATIARRVRGMQKTIFRAVATFVLDIR